MRFSNSGTEMTTKNTVTAIHRNADGLIEEKKTAEPISAPQSRFDSLSDSRESVSNIAELQNRAAAEIS